MRADGTPPPSAGPALVSGHFVIMLGAMKFWLSILFFLAEGALLAFGMVKAVGTDTSPSNLLPLGVALVVILGLFAKIGCIDNSPNRSH